MELTLDNQRRGPRRAATLAGAMLAVVVLAACGSGGSGAGGNQSASDFIRHVTTQFSLAQYGPLWGTLHPADQAIVTRSRYMACQSAVGFELRKLKVLDTYADTVYVAGKATASTAVSIRATSDDGVTTATMHAIKVGSGWRWMLSPRDLAAYKQGRCPSS